MDTDKHTRIGLKKGLVINRDDEIFHANENDGAVAFCEQIARKVCRENTNFLCFVVGLPGTGKSWCCLRLGELITSLVNKYNRENNIPEITFDERNIVFDKDEFQIKIDGRHALPPCSTIIFEEAGVALDSKNALSNDNKRMAHIVETFRYRRYVTLFNLPRGMNLDKTIRCICHCLITTKRLEPNNNRSFVKPLMIQFNPALDKIYWKNVMYKRNDKLFSVKHISLNKPGIKIVNRYERLKHEFASNMYQEYRGVNVNSDPHNEMDEKEKERIKEIEKKKVLDDLSFTEEILYNLFTNEGKKEYTGISDITKRTCLNSGSIGKVLKKLKKRNLIEYDLSDTNKIVVNPL